MYNFFTLFLMYSFAGFLLEMLYSRLVKAEKLDRKCFLFAPLCPVYGFGAAAIFSLPPVVLNHPPLLFIGGALAATLVEYLTALFYEHGVGVAFWDYSELPANLSGRVCLLFTAAWGALSCFLVYVIHPAVLSLGLNIPILIQAVLFLFLSADAIITLFLLHKSKSTDSLKWYASAGQKALLAS